MAFVMILAGFIPSLLWLRFYLRKDPHPEPRRLILEVFFFAILLAPLAVLAQWLFGALAQWIRPEFVVGDSPIFFFWAAFVEEMVKFLAVFYLVIHDPEFNEPVDAMIYLITASLGFAAIENIIVLFNNVGAGTAGCFWGIQSMWCILGFRTIGATLLHALASGLLGYFLALGWFYHEHSRKFLWCGIFLATFAHAIFNTLLLNFTPLAGRIISSILLCGLLFLLLILFHKLRQRSESRLMV